MGGFLATGVVGAELGDRGTLGGFTEQLPQTEDTGPCKRGETGLRVLPGAMEATCGDRFPLLVVLGHLALPQEWSVRPSHTHSVRRLWSVEPQQLGRRQGLHGTHVGSPAAAAALVAGHQKSLSGSATVRSMGHTEPVLKPEAQPPS